VRASAYRAAGVLAVHDLSAAFSFLPPPSSSSNVVATISILPYLPTPDPAAFLLTPAEIEESAVVMTPEEGNGNDEASKRRLAESARRFVEQV
jgi:hypothetical protein